MATPDPGGAGQTPSRPISETASRWAPSFVVEFVVYESRYASHARASAMLSPSLRNRDARARAVLIAVAAAGISPCRSSRTLSLQHHDTVVAAIHRGDASPGNAGDGERGDAAPCGLSPGYSINGRTREAGPADAHIALDLPRLSHGLTSCRHHGLLWPTCESLRTAHRG